MSNETAPDAPSLDSIPSIASSAMLCDLSMSHWSAVKIDSRVSKEVEHSHAAEAGTAEVRKMLLGNCAELKAIKAHIGHTRNNIHYKFSLPWYDNGVRIVSTGMYFTHLQKMSEAQDEYWRLVEVFLSVYQWEVSKAQAKLGSLFYMEEYPTADQVRAKFDFKLSYTPMPKIENFEADSDFRTAIGTEAAEVLQQQAVQWHQRKLGELALAIWQPTYEAMKKMSDQLAKAVAYDGQGRKDFKLYGSLVDNLLTQIDILDKCNLSDDPTMARLAGELRRTLKGVTIEGLKEDQGLCKEVKDSVDDLIKQIPSIGEW